MECSTPDKPEVLAITVKMGWDDPDLTVGKLFKMWRWFDQQTTEGNAAGVTPALLDRYFGVSGFVTAVAEVGWLVINEEGVSLPNFDRHNGASAKQRSLTAKRVANHKTNAKGNANTVTKSVTSPLPREEKRREDKEKEQKNSNVTVADLVAQGVSFDSANELLAIRKKKRSALTQLAWKGISSEFNKAGISADEGIAIMSKRGWQSFEAQWIKKEIGNAHSKSRFDVIAETTAALTGRRNISERVIEGFAKQVG